MFSGYAVTDGDRKIPALHIRWYNWIDFLYRHGRRCTEGHTGIMYVLGDSFSVGEGNWRRHSSGRRFWAPTVGPGVLRVPRIIRGASHSQVYKVFKFSYMYHITMWQDSTRSHEST